MCVFASRPHVARHLKFERVCFAAFRRSSARALRRCLVVLTHLADCLDHATILNKVLTLVSRADPVQPDQVHVARDPRHEAREPRDRFTRRCSLPQRGGCVLETVRRKLGRRSCVKVTMNASPDHPNKADVNYEFVRDVCGKSEFYLQKWASGCHSNATVHRHPHYMHEHERRSIHRYTHLPHVYNSTRDVVPGEPGAAPNLQARWERRRARLQTHIWIRPERTTTTFHTTPPRIVLHEPSSTFHDGYGRRHAGLLECVATRGLQAYLFLRPRGCRHRWTCLEILPGTSSMHLRHMKMARRMRVLRHSSLSALLESLVSVPDRARFNAHDDVATLPSQGQTVENFRFWAVTLCRATDNRLSDCTRPIPSC